MFHLPRLALPDALLETLNVCFWPWRKRTALMLLSSDSKGVEYEEDDWALLTFDETCCCLGSCCTWFISVAAEESKSFPFLSK